MEFTVAIETGFPSGESFVFFAYGTLKRGGGLHRVLAGQRFLGEAWTQPDYALFHLGAYPGLVHRSPHGRRIQGELYEVEISLIEELNAVEGAPGLFQLEPVLIDGRSGAVFAYFYQRSIAGLPLCAEDRWTNERVGP